MTLGLNDFLRAVAVMPPPGPRAPAIFGLQLDLGPAEIELHVQRFAVFEVQLDLNNPALGSLL